MLLHAPGINSLYSTKKDCIIFCVIYSYHTKHYKLKLSKKYQKEVLVNHVAIFQDEKYFMIQSGWYIIVFYQKWVWKRNICLQPLFYFSLSTQIKQHHHFFFLHNQWLEIWKAPLLCPKSKFCKSHLIRLLNLINFQLKCLTVLECVGTLIIQNIWLFALGVQILVEVMTFWSKNQ